ncbi:MAG: glycosyltransferase family 39 protein [Verrucomicrobia bacterium]|nr:glycosyltransferase family 39 protein [Verrucomicrobiota bacterium]
MNNVLTGRLAPFFLLGFTLLMLLPGTGTLPLLDRDEPRFATASREMAERSDWIIPTFNGHDRFDKPALSYWLMRCGYAIFGQNEFGARFPNVLCAAALVLIVWWQGRRWFGDAVGWLAAIGLATCIQLFIHGRLALADLPMVLAITVIQIALAALLFPANRAWGTSPTPAPAERITEEDHAHARGWWWALWVSVAVGFLAKGPITLAVPLVSLLLLRFAFWREPLPWHRLAAGRGALLALALIALWGIPALIATEGRFFAVGIGEHVVKRGYEKFNGRSYNPFFYLTTAPLSLFPWIVFAPLAWFALKTRDIRHRWLASWLTAPYLIFTLYATQLPHYVLPAFPAFFLLLGEGLTAPRPAWRRGGLIALTVLAVVVLIGLVALQFRPLPDYASMLRPAFTGLFLVVLGLLGIAGGTVSGGKWLRAGLIGGGLGVAAGASLLAGGLRSASLSIALPSRWIDAPAGTRFIGAGFTEPSLVFYSHRLWLNDLTPAELAGEIAKPGPLVVVTVDRQIDPIHLFTGLDRWRVQTAPPAALTRPGWTRQTLAGFNPGRTRWQELSVWRRD